MKTKGLEALEVHELLAYGCHSGDIKIFIPIPAKWREVDAKIREALAPLNWTQTGQSIESQVSQDLGVFDLIEDWASGGGGD